MILKTIDGYPDYKISEDGRVFSFKRKTPKELSPYIDKDGYVIFVLYKNGIRKAKKSHRLVANTYLDNPNDFPEVNHKDGDKNNNHFENLEWTTKETNQEHAFETGLAAEMPKPVIGIDVHTGEIIRFSSVNEAARNGYSLDRVSGCCNRKKGYDTHKGYKWRFDRCTGIKRN